MPSDSEKRLIHALEMTKNTVAYHLITTSMQCIVIVLHNHPSLSKFSLEDVKLFLTQVN